MSDEPRDQYTFDYTQARPNRFAGNLKKGGRLVVLEPEVAEAFRESESVNAVLRALLDTMPGKAEAKPVPVVSHTGPDAAKNSDDAGTA